MDKLEKARLYTVSGSIDRPVREMIAGRREIEIQFNPGSLKVALSNTIGSNQRSGTSRAAQYIDSGSSTLTVELIFDTSDNPSTDVRGKTRPIALAFMQPEEVGNQNVAPRRCLFAWGSFAFVGIMERFDETLDFFSPDGIPLRATVALRLAESRFQFHGGDARDTPTLGGGFQSVGEANLAAGKAALDWRVTAMFNGVESPRLSAGASLSVPGFSATASLKGSASVTGGLSGGFGAGLKVGGGGAFGGGLQIDAGASAGGGLSMSAELTPPAFSFGASASLGSGIPGAFSADIESGGGIPAGAIVSGGLRLHEPDTGSTAGGSPTGQRTLTAKSNTTIGFD